MRQVVIRVLTAALFGAPLILASCSAISPRERLAARLHRYEAYAGKPVKQIRWVNNYKRWSAIGRDKLLVWTDINRPYLVTVYRPCTDLLFAHGIAVTSTIDTVQPRSSFVIADGWRCMISTIQPIDYQRMQRDERHGQGATASAPNGHHQR